MSHSFVVFLFLGKWISLGNMPGCRSPQARGGEPGLQGPGQTVSAVLYILTSITNEAILGYDEA